MAELGTITVAIEAQTEQLKKGLADAERAVVAASQKMEDAQVTVTEKISKSWTEFRNKIGVVVAAANIAEKAVTTLANVMVIAGKDGASAMEKYNLMLDEVQKAGIPVISQAIGIGTVIRGWLDGSLKALAELNAEMAEFAKTTAKVNKAMKFGIAAASLRDEAEAAEKSAAVVLASRNKVRQFEMEQALERENLIARLDEKVRASGAVRAEVARAAADRVLAAHDEVAAAARREFDQNQELAIQSKIDAENEAGHQIQLAWEVARQKRRSREEGVRDLEAEVARLEAEAAGTPGVALLVEEGAIFNKYRKMANRLEDEKRMAILKLKGDEEKAAVEVFNKKAELIERLRGLEIEAARHKAEAAEERATEDLQKQLQVLQAEAAGDQLGAQLIELEAKFRRMRETATDDQKKIIDEIETLERQALVSAAAPAAADIVSADPVAATASMATAIGGFTIATGGSPQVTEIKRSNQLLEKLVENTEREPGREMVEIAA